MKIIFKAPGRVPEIRDIDGSLKTLQELVGGNIEPITLHNGMVILCDEEGKLRGKEPNIWLERIKDTLVGNVIFLGEDGEEFTDFPEEHLDAVLAILPLISVKEAKHGQDQESARLYYR